MWSISCCLFAITIGTVTAAQYRIEEYPPITHVYTNYGHGDHERVIYIRAHIFPHHINNGSRINFPSHGLLNDYFLAARAEGDERGHLVASQFSGASVWFNLSPQNMRVNRNAGFMSITTDWYGAECEVRRFLERGGDRHVTWEVNMDYSGDSNRPNTYRLRVNFFIDQSIVDAIDTTIHNPLLREDSTFYICRVCRASRHRRGANPLLDPSEHECEKEKTEDKSDNLSTKIETFIAGGLMFIAGLYASST